jgi:hypothetical protein
MTTTTPEPYDETIDYAAREDARKDPGRAKANEVWERISDTATAREAVARHVALVAAINEHGVSDFEYRRTAAEIAACRLSGVEGLSGRSLVFEAQAVEAYLRGEQ